MYSVVDLAIERAGGRSKDLARLLGVTRQAVEAWKKNGKIPLKHVPTIANELNIDIRLLAPEFYAK